METIIVKVTGTQRDSEGDENRIELTAVGRQYAKNGINYITYHETELSGMEGTTTLLKVTEDCVAVIRMGKIEHKQEFRLGEKTYSTYITPYGQMKMAATTNRLDLAYDGVRGKIYVEYELEIDGQLQSYNELTIDIREERTNGY